MLLAATPLLLVLTKCPALTSVRLFHILSRSFTEGIYVLYTYTASAACGQAVQRYLSLPTAGNEVNVLRHMTFLGNSA